MLHPKDGNELEGSEATDLMNGFFCNTSSGMAKEFGDEPEKFSIPEKGECEALGPLSED